MIRSSNQRRACVICRCSSFARNGARYSIFQSVSTASYCFYTCWAQLSHLNYVYRTSFVPANGIADIDLGTMHNMEAWMNAGTRYDICRSCTSIRVAISSTQPVGMIGGSQIAVKTEKPIWSRLSSSTRSHHARMMDGKSRRKRDIKAFQFIGRSCPLTRHTTVYRSFLPTHSTNNCSSI